MRAWDSAGRGVPPPSPAPAPYEVVDVDPAPQPNNLTNLKEHYLVVVLQRKSMPIEYTLTMDDYEFWNVWVKENLKAPYTELQPGTEDAKQFEDAARIPAPFVMLVPTRGPAVWTMPLPKGSADAVKVKLGAK